LRRTITKPKMNRSKIRKEIAEYFEATRQKGHSTVLRQGVNNIEHCIVVVTSNGYSSQFPNAEVIMPLEAVEKGELRGMSLPLVVDNAALMEICGEDPVECMAASAPVSEVPKTVRESKVWRAQIEQITSEVKASSRKSRERSTTITKLQEARMWLGEDLACQREEGILNEPSPYPQGNNPDSPVIEPRKI
jgi:hypothetical protein